MYRHILVPSDGSKLSQKAVEYGVALAVSDAEMDAVNPGESGEAIIWR